MKFISKLFLYVFVAVIAYLIFLPALMPLGLTPFTKEYHEGYNDYFRGYSSKYNATRGNSFSLNIESFRDEAYCVGYEDAWGLSDLKKNEHRGKVITF
jgi:hypothetical protein